MDEILKRCRFLIGINQTRTAVTCDAMLPSGERAGVTLEIEPGANIPAYLDDYEKFTVERFLREINNNQNQ
jgi:hypothetical protein